MVQVRATILTAPLPKPPIHYSHSRMSQRSLPLHLLKLAPQKWKFSKVDLVQALEVVAKIGKQAPQSGQTDTLSQLLK